MVTRFSGLGPWRDSVFLVGGLAPRYIVTKRPPDVPPHAGTGDIDVVVDLSILADTEAYRTLDQNLKKMGFERAENDKGNKVNWRWQTMTEHGILVILEFLADDPQAAGWRIAGTAEGRKCFCREYPTRVARVRTPRPDGSHR